MSANITLSNTLTSQLKQAAEEQHLSVDELAEQVLAGYVGDQTIQDENIDYDLTNEELAELKASIVEAETENVWYSPADIKQMAAEMIKQP